MKNKITNELELQRLLDAVAEYARFNFNSKLTPIQVLDGAKDIVKQSFNNDEVSE